jgi:hypothetical protein
MATWVSRPGGGPGAGAAAPGAAPPARLRPARGWYLVAGAVIVAGVAWFVAGMVALNGQINSLQRVALPGTGQITLTHSGSYVIYYEGPGAADGNIPAFSVGVRPLSGSAAVQGITHYSGSFSISGGGRADAAALTLRIARPGRFLVETTAPTAPAGSHIAVGSSITASLGRLIFPFAALIVVGGGSATAIALIRRSRAKRERRRALPRFALQHGMAYTEDDPYGLPARDFRLFREGEGRGCRNVLSGRWQNLPVTEADYWYYTNPSTAGSTTGSGGFSFTSQGFSPSNRSYYYFSIVLADLAVTVPYVSIRKATLFTKLAGHLGVHDIELGSADFDRQFKVTAADKEFAAKLIDPAMMQWLLSTGGEFAFEIGGTHLLVSCKLLPVTGLVKLLDTAKGFTDHIPQLVWAGHKTGLPQTPALPPRG